MDLTKIPRVNLGAREESAVPAFYEIPAMLLTHRVNMCWTPLYVNKHKQHK